MVELIGRISIVFGIISAIIYLIYSIVSIRESAIGVEDNARDIALIKEYLGISEGMVSVNKEVD